MTRALALLAQTQSRNWVSQADVWQMIKRLDSTFDPRDHGYANFLTMLKALDALVDVGQCEVERGVRLR